MCVVYAVGCTRIVGGIFFCFQDRLNFGIIRCMVERIRWNENIMEKSRRLLKYFKIRQCEQPQKFKYCDT